MSIYLCGVFNGPVTGQLHTLLGIEEALINNYCLKKVKYPPPSIYFLFSWLIFITKTVFIFANNRDIFYMVIHRSRLSFWLRDLPIFVIASVYKSKIICHLVGSDIEDFVKRSSSLEKFLLKKFFSNISSWVLLGDSMNKQVEESYKFLEIENNSKCFNKGKLSSYFLRGFYPNESAIYVNDSFIDKKLHKFGSELKISFMSNLMEDKGIVEFIESAISLREENNIKIEVFIAGAIIENSSERLKIALKKATNKSYINFLGLVNGKEKWELLSKTDIFVLPTYYKTEALPLSLIEAMRFGCLCISSNIGEINELLKDDRGIIIDKVNTKNLLDTIKLAIKDDESSKSKMINSFKYADKNFSFNVYKDNLKDIIERHID